MSAHFIRVGSRKRRWGRKEWTKRSSWLRLPHQSTLTMLLKSSAGTANMTATWSRSLRNGPIALYFAKGVRSTELRMFWHRLQWIMRLHCAYTRALLNCYKCFRYSLPNYSFVTFLTIIHDAGNYFSKQKIERKCSNLNYGPGHVLNWI